MEKIPNQPHVELYFKMSDTLREKSSIPANDRMRRCLYQVFVIGRKWFGNDHLWWSFADILKSSMYIFDHFVPSYQPRPSKSRVALGGYLTLAIHRGLLEVSASPADISRYADWMEAAYGLDFYKFYDGEYKGDLLP